MKRLELVARNRELVLSQTEVSDLQGTLNAHHYKAESGGGFVLFFFSTPKYLARLSW